VTSGTSRRQSPEGVKRYFITNLALYKERPRVLDSHELLPYTRRMQATHGTLASATGETLFYRYWRPSSAPPATVVLVHGLSEHSVRYEHVGAFLAELGLAVYAHDHLGHGRSGGKRGWVARFDDFLDDVGRMHALAMRECPGVPVFLLGHSMGGLIAAAYVVTRRPKPQFLILSGPAIVPLLDPNDRTIDPSRLSKDPEVQRAYLEDPLCLRERVTDELFVRLAEGVAMLPGHAGEIDMPCLLIHGDADVLCSHTGAEAWLAGAASRDVTMKIYPGGRHEMFNEMNKDEVLADTWEWIRRHLPARA
jgi:alpha-beta hydrolase superfamily lysophospholipase